MSNKFLYKIEEEQAATIERFGEQNWEPFTFLSILLEEAGEACKAANDSYNYKTGEWNKERLEHLKSELVQTASVCKTFFDALERDSWQK